MLAIDPFALQSEFYAAANSLEKASFLELWPLPILWVVLPVYGRGQLMRAAKIPEAGEYYRERLLDGQASQADAEPARPYLDRAASLQKPPENPFPHMISVGRSESSDVVIELRSVSELHAYFLRTEEGWRLTDWGSAHGSHVNGVPVPARTHVDLQSGDRISFGPDFEAIFQEPRDLYEELRQPG
jgi:pSer/pThr/pTyr-binding forkhead associated (FHA) protein